MTQYPKIDYFQFKANDFSTIKKSISLFQNFNKAFKIQCYIFYHLISGKLWISTMSFCICPNKLFRLLEKISSWSILLCHDFKFSLVGVIKCTNVPYFYVNQFFFLVHDKCFFFLYKSVNLFQVRACKYLLRENGDVLNYYNILLITDRPSSKTVMRWWVGVIKCTNVPYFYVNQFFFLVYTFYNLFQRIHSFWLYKLHCSLFRFLASWRNSQFSGN
jgi:hypothetical protein